MDDRGKGDEVKMHKCMDNFFFQKFKDHVFLSDDTDNCLRILSLILTHLMVACLTRFCLSFYVDRPLQPPLHCPGQGCCRYTVPGIS